MNAFTRRVENLTPGRFIACMFTAFLIIMVMRVAAIFFHMHIAPIVGALAYMILFMSRLWRVCSFPPPQRPFSHM